MTESVDEQNTQHQRYVNWGKRLGAWSCVALTAALVPFSGELGLKALADDVPQLRSFQPQSEHLYLRLPERLREGQKSEIQLAWRNLPAASVLQAQELSLEWKTRDYLGQEQIHQEKVELGLSLKKLPLLISSPGKHDIQIKNAQNQLLKTISVDVEPFPASVFPAHWERYRDLGDDPTKFQVMVNLFYDPEKQADQRQHLQVLYDGEIIERLLISSGAPGHETPQGVFKVGTKEYYPRSSLYNDTPMPFWSAININGNNGEYGFHSLEGGSYLYLLGRPASHGCVRLSRKPSVETHPETGEQYWGDRGGARWIFDRVPKDAPIHIFTRQLPQFKAEDYAQYLARMAEEYKAAQKTAQKEEA